MNMDDALREAGRKAQTHCQCGRPFAKRRRDPKTNLCRHCYASSTIREIWLRDHGKGGRIGVTDNERARIIEMLRVNPLPMVKRDSGRSYRTIFKIVLESGL